MGVCECAWCVREGVYEHVSVGQGEFVSMCMCGYVCVMVSVGEHVCGVSRCDI